jgi:hypothetical protein
LLRTTKPSAKVGNRLYKFNIYKNMYWTPTTWEEACRRANGRSKYNAARRKAADERRRQIAVALNPPDGYGVQSRLAEFFGVNKSTISRDFQALNLERSPHCGLPMPNLEEMGRSGTENAGK